MMLRGLCWGAYSPGLPNRRMQAEADTVHYTSRREHAHGRMVWREGAGRECQRERVNLAIGGAPGENEGAGCGRREPVPPAHPGRGSRCRVC